MSHRRVRLDHQPSPAEIVDMARRGVAFEGGWIKGRRTKGGTFIVTSKGFQFDDDQDRDSIAITAWGKVAQLGLAVAPDWVEEIEQAIAATKAVAS